MMVRKELFRRIVRLLPALLFDPFRGTGGSWVIGTDVIVEYLDVVLC